MLKNGAKIFEGLQVDCAACLQVRLLVDKLGESVDAVDVYGRTPLMLASLIHNEPTGDAIVRFLLSRRAKVSFYASPLMHFLTALGPV